MEIKRRSEGSETWNKWGVCTSAEIKYLVKGAANKRAAIQAVIAQAPSAYGEHNELPLEEIRFDGFEGDDFINLTAIYTAEDETEEEADSEEATMSFDCASGTKHMSHALTQEMVYPNSMKGKDDAACGIGWNGKTGSEAEFAGVDVPTAEMREVYVKYFPVSRLTTAYKRLLAELHGKVNNKPFKGWDAGEVLFDGASYSRVIKSKAKVQVTFNFRISPNEKNATVSGKKVGNKKGWEYMWARSETENDTTENAPKVDIKGIYKSGVIEYADFSRLGV